MLPKLSIRLGFCRIREREGEVTRGRGALAADGRQNAQWHQDIEADVGGL